MLVTTGNIDALFTGYKAAFQKGFAGAKPIHKEISILAPSQKSDEIYSWLGQFPGMRKWVGPRIVNNLSVHAFSIKNEKFEDTVSVPREKIEDDTYGVFTHFMEEMGRSAAQKPEELVITLLKDGFVRMCYDGQNFFDTDHPVTIGDSAPVIVSNMQAGAGEPWFLLDCSRAIKPLIWQERLPFDQLDRLDKNTDQNVFLNDEFIYGVRGRGNAGYGLWQLAYASKAPLTAANYEAARKAMMNLKGEGGLPLGVKPDTLVVSPNNEGAAMRVLNNGTRTETVDNGSGGTNAVALANEWAGSATLLVSPWLA